MLMELPLRRRNAEDAQRRWFFSHEQELIVWLDESGQIRGFQLCYDKNRSERAITWRRERGFEHAVVDDGHCFAGDCRTPFLYPNGHCDVGRVIARFREGAQALPVEVRRLVIERLGEYWQKTGRSP